MIGGKGELSVKGKLYYDLESKLKSGNKIITKALIDSLVITFWSGSEEVGKFTALNVKPGPVDGSGDFTWN